MLFMLFSYGISNCLVCNKKFNKTTVNKLYCSYKCQRKSNNAKYSKQKRQNNNIQNDKDTTSVIENINDCVEITNKRIHQSHKIERIIATIKFSNVVTLPEYRVYMNRIESYRLPVRLTKDDYIFFNKQTYANVCNVKMVKTTKPYNLKFLFRCFDKWKWIKQNNKRIRSIRKYYYYKYYRDSHNRIKKFIGTNNEEYTIDMVQLRQELWQDRSIEIQGYLSSNIEADKQ